MITAILMILLCIVLDQCAKSRAKRELDKTVRSYGFLSFSLVKNEGAFLGFLKNNKKALLILQSVVVGICFIFLAVFVYKKDKLATFRLSLILGGAIGNLIDRIKDGYVTDFFAVRWTKNVYYNLADMFVFLGTLITLIKP